MANFWDRLNNLVKRKITRRRVPTSVPYGQTGPGFYASQIFGSKLATSIYEHNLQSTSDRLARIRDYDAMDTTPIVSTALNVYSDDASSYGEEGQVLTVICDNQKMLEDLQYLFYDILNVDFNIYHQIRTLPLKYDTFIPLLNGEIITIKELSQRIKNGEVEWVYSIKDETNEILPGKVIWCDKNYNSNKIIKITLEDDTFVESAPEHLFILKNGKTIRADELNVNDPLMPFYRKLSNKNKNHKVKNIEVLNENSDVYCMTVVGPNNEEDRHNFAICSKNIINGEVNKNNSGIFVKNCKYGDKFELLSIEKGKGVTGTIALPTAEIEREEAFGGDPTSVRFKWVAQTGAAYNEFQIAHFRLMGDDNFLPYGRCLKWNTYIETPSGMKMIKDIRRGDGIYSFDLNTKKKIITTVKDVICSGKKEIYKIKTKNNYVELSKEHKVMIWNPIENKFDYKNVLDLKIGELIVINNNKEKIIDKKEINKGEYILTPILSIKPTKEIEEVYDVYVDNSNHNFFANGIIVHNSVLESGRGIWKKLQLLEDAMLIYRISRAAEKRVFQIEVGNVPYDQVETFIEQQKAKIKTESIINPSTGEIDLRYRISALTDDYWLAKRGDMMSSIETLPGGCLALNTKIALLDGRNLELQEIIKEFNDDKQLWTYSCNPETGKPCGAPITWAGITKRNVQVMKLTLDNGKTLICTLDHKFPVWNKGKVEAQNLEIGDSIISFEKELLEYKNCEKYNEQIFNNKIIENYNHKVTNIEFLDEKMDVGTITVDGNEKYTNNHTFALSDCLIYTYNSHLNDIEDVEYIKQQLITSLGVPKAFLQFEDDLEGKSSASKVDMRFARSIQRIQKIMISEFSKIAILHLFAKEKYTDDEIFNFELKMHNPSAIMELGKLEIMEKKFDIYNKAVNDSKAISMTKAKKEILDMTEEELKQESKQLMDDAKFTAKVQKTVEGGGEPVGTEEKASNVPESGNSGQEQDKLSDMLDSLEADSIGGEKTPSIKQTDKGELKTGADYDLASDTINSSVNPEDTDLLFESMFSRNGKIKLVEFLNKKDSEGENFEE